LQQLHLVGFTTEHDALIFSARKGAKSGGFLVAVDDALYDTIDEIGRLRDGDGDTPKRRRSVTPRPESALSPRDIQMRLRAGRSVAHIASEAGVDEEWVLRFAAPIQAEQAQVIAKTQKLSFAKARLGSSGRPLGESVWWNIADKGALMAESTFDQCWSALHMRDSSWVVRFDFINRKKRQRAEWEVDVREGSLTARNRLASELGYVEPNRRGKPPAPLPPEAKPVPKVAAPPPPPKAVATKRAASKRAAAKKATAKKASAKKASAKKAPAKKASAKKATKRAPASRSATKRAPAKKATKRAPAKKAPAKRTAAKKTAVRRPAPKRAAVKRSAAKKSAVRRPAPKRTVAKRTAAKRPAAKRPAAPRSARQRPLRAPAVPTAAPVAARAAKARQSAATAARAAIEPAVEKPPFDTGEPTRPVTIRASLASGPDAPAPRPDAPPKGATAPEREPAAEAAVPDAPVAAPPVLTSTPTPAPARAADAPRGLGRLRRRRPPGS
jgi:hypothetical protein